MNFCKKFLFAVLSLFVITLNGQSFVITVIDAASGDTLQNIELLHLDKDRIYYSDEYGQVEIKGEFAGFDLLVTQLGYSQDTFTISDTNSNVIAIHELVYSIPSFEFAASDLPLLDRVVNAIEDNYPVQTEFLVGNTTEEVTYITHGEKAGRYRSEIKTLTAKSRYKKGHHAGPVWMREVLDTVRSGRLRAVFIAGHHNAHRFDFVMRREGPLQKSTRNKYSINTEENDGRIKIGFFSQKDEGFILINKENLAIEYGYFEVKGEMKGDEEYGYGSGGQRSYLVYETFYDNQGNQDNYYRIDSVHYRSEVRSDTTARKVRNTYKLKSVSSVWPKDASVLALDQYNESIYNFAFSRYRNKESSTRDESPAELSNKQGSKKKRKSYIGAGILSSTLPNNLSVVDEGDFTEYPIDNVSYLLTTGSEILSGSNASLSYFASFDPSKKGFTNIGLEGLLQRQIGSTFSTVGLKFRMFYNTARFNISEDFKNESIFPLAIDGTDYLQDELDISIQTTALAIGTSVQVAFRVGGSERLAIELGYSYGLSLDESFFFKQRDAGFLRKKDRLSIPVELSDSSFRYPLSISVLWLTF